MIRCPSRQLIPSLDKIILAYTQMATSCPLALLLNLLMAEFEN